MSSPEPHRNAHDALVELLKEPQTESDAPPLDWEAHMEMIARRAQELGE